jgi:hypothetical protein
VRRENKETRMASKTKKTRKSETKEQMLARWLASSAKGFNAGNLMSAGWEPGMHGYITIDGLNYERFDLPTDGYVVVEWDTDGNYVVL